MLLALSHFAAINVSLQQSLALQDLILLNIAMFLVGIIVEQEWIITLSGRKH